MKINLCVLVLGAFFSNVLSAAEADDVVGLWQTEGGKSQVEIYAKQDRYFGKIVWLKKPVYDEGEVEGMDGKAKIDRNNPDEDKRTRPILGLEILQRFEHDGEQLWKSGTIYDPQSGSTYKCKMTLSDDGKTLSVRGYVGFSLFGRTTEWIRVIQ